MSSVTNNKKYVEDIYPISDSSDSEDDCCTGKPRFTPRLQSIKEQKVEDEFEMRRTCVTRNSIIINKNLEKIKEENQ
jgi:hypothetical protein